MNLRDEILREHSKAQCLLIAEWVGNSSKRFEELLDLFLHDEYRVVQRAAWPLSYCSIKHPNLAKKHLGTLIKNLVKPGIHNAVKRNTLRLLQDINIPTEYHGEIMNTCFQFISSNTEPVAVKCFSITVLQNLLPHYPEILPELKLVIEERMKFETAGFRARAKKVIATES